MREAELKEALLKLLKEKAILKGKFTLASGKTADYYIDGKQITLLPEGILYAGKLILTMLQGMQVNAIGGPTLGAAPLAAACALLSSQTGKPLKAFLVRKESKTHGTEKTIEGPPLEEGDHVAIVDDVITTGSSVLRAIEEVTKQKAKVVRVIALVDRKEGAQEKLEAYSYTPIFTIDDLGLSS